MIDFFHVRVVQLCKVEVSNKNKINLKKVSGNDLKPKNLFRIFMEKNEVKNIKNVKDFKDFKQEKISVNLNFLESIIEDK